MAIYNEAGQRLCEFPECGRRHSAKGLCMAHKMQQDAGKELAPIRFRTPKYTGCTEEACKRAHFAKGLCNNHYEASRYTPYLYVTPPEHLGDSVRPVVGIPHYWVTDKGEVWSEYRGGYWMTPQQRGSQRNPVGYYYVNLSHEGDYYSRKIAHLVLEAFVGPRPTGHVACHGILGQLNDSLENLTWGTMSKNMGEDKRRDGTLIQGEAAYNARLTEDMVRTIRDDYASGVANMPALAKRYGLATSTVSRIIHRQAWTHVA